MQKWNAAQIGDQSGRVAIVTGANTGIGYAAAAELARKGAQVILACRSPERGEAAEARLKESVEGAQARFMALDLANLQKVQAFVDAFTADFDRLDLLINNAGVMMCPQSQTAQGFELQIGVNHFGHFALTMRLLPLLRKTPGARVVNVSSQAHRQGKMNFDDLHFERRRYTKMGAYGQSKLANLLFTFELQRKLAAEGADVKALAAHPGWTGTDLQRHVPLFEKLNPYFSMPTEQGALPTLRAATDPEVQGGEYFGPDGFYEMRGYPKRVNTTRAARNASDAETLWRLSEEATGCRA